MADTRAAEEAAIWLKIFTAWQHERAMKDAKLVKSILSAWGIV